MRNYSLKNWLVGGGIASLAAGISCLPMGFGISPKRDLSAFNNIADMGGFLKAAGVFIVVGILLILISCFIKEDY